MMIKLTRRAQETKKVESTPVQRKASYIKKSKQKNKFFVILYDPTNRFTDDEIIPHGFVCLANNAREASRKLLGEYYLPFRDQTLKIDIYNVTGESDTPIQKDMYYSDVQKLINVLKTPLTKMSLHYKAVRATEKFILLHKQTSRLIEV